MTPPGILALPGERELWHRRVNDAWRAGMAHGEAIHAQDYDRGYADAIASIKRTEQQIIRALRNHQTLWVVRGQKRTRETFAQPHPRDYAGGPVQPW